jgi:hypothetical protein
MGNSDSKCNNQKEFSVQAIESILEESTNRLFTLTNELIDIENKITNETNPKVKALLIQQNDLLFKNYTVVIHTMGLMTQTLVNYRKREMKMLLNNNESMNRKLNDCVQVVIDPNPYF